MENLKMRKDLVAKIPGHLKGKCYEFKRGERVKVVDLNSMGYVKVTGMGKQGCDPKYFWTPQESLHEVISST